ncbi:MAG: LysR family transcriptional regulator [Dongiaceae bacterium]
MAAHRAAAGGGRRLAPGDAARLSPRLTIKHLEVLAAFRNTGNLSRIGEILKLTPSAVSRRIDEAEARLGVALFVNSSNRVRLTPAGEYVLQAAERVLADLDRAESVAIHLGNEVRQVLRIGMSIYRSFAWMPGFTAHLSTAMPGLRAEIVGDSTGGEAEALASGVADVVLTPLIDEFPGTWRVPLFDDELVALVAPAHRLAGRSCLQPADLEPEDYYTYDMAVTPGFEFLRFLRPAGVKPRRYVVVDTPESAAAVVRSGQGITVLSRWAMRAEIEDRRLVALPLAERGLRVAWTALLRQGDGKGSPAHQMTLQLRRFLRQD